MGSRSLSACVVLAALLSSPALGFIERIYSLKEVLDESNHVCVGRLELVDPEKRIAVGVIERSLKGTTEFQRVRMNLGIGPDDHARYLLPLLKAGEPFILYYKRDGNNIASCAHAGGTWYQLFAADEPDRNRVWWRLSHIEVYMGRTFLGATSDLIQLTADVLAGRTAPPKADPRVPRLDLGKRPPAVARRVEQGPDGLEAIPGWDAEQAWARPASVAILDTPHRGKVLSASCDGQPDRKLALTLLQHVDLSQSSQFTALVDNDCDRPLAVAVAFGCAPDWVMFEAPAAAVPARAKAAPVRFSLATRHFKCEASKWQHTQPLPNGGSIDKVMLLVEGIPEKGSVRFDLVRGTRGGFARRIEFPHPGGEARGIAWADVDGDERLDAALCCGDGNVVLLNQGDGFKNATAQLGLKGGSRAAAWADYNADNHPDLLTSNFQLFTNADGRLRDDSALIQVPGGRNPEGAGWIDYNGDGLPDILIANGEHGIRLLENTGKGPQWFRDVSDKAGLGPKGLGVGNGDFIAFADVDGDGYTDFLYNLGDGVLAHNEGGKGFKLDTRAGLRIGASNEAKRGVVFADFDNDGDLDLFVPGPGRPRLYRNNNDGTFTNVADAAGDLATLAEASFAAAWGDANNDGFLDLLVCCTKAGVRLYLGDGKGGFKDATEAAGLAGLAPAYAASFADVDDDGDLDLLVNLEGKAVLVVNDMDRAPDRAFLEVRVHADKGVVGAVVRVADEKGRPLGLRELGGAESCGGQACPVAHFGLPLGKCQVSACLTDGRVAQEILTIPASGARLTFREAQFR